MGQSERRGSVFDTINPSPRVKMAARLFGAGALNKKDASRTAGLHPLYLSLLRHNPKVNAIIAEAEAAVAAGAVDMSNVIKNFGRLGLVHIAKTMQSDNVKDETRLKAAQDLADRSPETAKTNKISVEGDVTLTQLDAARMMEALVEASKAAEQFRTEVSSGDYVKVDDSANLQPAVLPPLLPEA